ncbi:hypothetical protein MP228_012516 [Amoeboaphelidium protococcarum]|nr:hypothetical protein MP228_012516 [Amoeboaphelidium protococcarum]
MAPKNVVPLQEVYRRDELRQCLYRLKIAMAICCIFTIVGALGTPQFQSRMAQVACFFIYLCLLFVANALLSINELHTIQSGTRISKILAVLQSRRLNSQVQKFIVLCTRNCNDLYGRLTDIIEVLCFVYIFFYGGLTALCAYFNPILVVVNIIFISNMPLLAYTMAYSRRFFIVINIYTFLVLGLVLSVIDAADFASQNLVDVKIGICFYHCAFVSLISYQMVCNYEWYDRRVQGLFKQAEESNIAKDNFLNTVSHELRNPLHCINGSLHLLQQTDLTAEQEELVNTLKDCTTTLSSIIGNVLDASKISSSQPKFVVQKFSVYDLVKRLNSIYASLCKAKSLDYKFVSAGRDDFMRWCKQTQFLGDEGKIQQVLNNLVTNAIKFTESGSVSLQIEKVPLVQKEDASSSVTLQFTVKDTGIGVSKQFEEQLFQKFTQQDNSILRNYGGSGLGLYISRELADFMGGCLSYDREQAGDRGACFVFQVPLQIDTTNHVPAESNGRVLSPVSDQSTMSDESNGEIAVQSESSSDSAIDLCKQQANKRKKMKVFIVDDDSIVRTLMVRILMKWNYDVQEYMIATDALNDMNNGQNKADVIFLDLQMPVMDGFSCLNLLTMSKCKQLGITCDRIDQITPQQMDTLRNTLPLVYIMSGNVLDSEREKCVAAKDFLSKPVQFKQLQTTLQQCESLIV